MCLLAGSMKFAGRWWPFWWYYTCFFIFSCNLLLHAVCFTFHESFQDKTLNFSYIWNMALCWRMVQSANVDAWTFLINTYVLNCQWSCVQLVVVGTSPILCALESAIHVFFVQELWLVQHLKCLIQKKTWKMTPWFQLTGPNTFSRWTVRNQHSDDFLR